MGEAGVPFSSLTVLGALIASGAPGLVVGFAVPVIGTVAAIGPALFFVAALGMPSRDRVEAYRLPAFFLTPGVASLVPRVAYRVAGDRCPGGGRLRMRPPLQRRRSAIGGSWTRRRPPLSR